MDAFEQIAARLFEVQGYWTRIGYAVELTKQQKSDLGKPSLPRPQLDIVAFKPSANEILVVECKSYLDSYGVRFEDFHGKDDAEKDVYKMFNRRRLREVVLAAVVDQLQREGLVTATNPTVRLVLVAGKHIRRQRAQAPRVVQSQRVDTRDSTGVISGLRAFADRGYENDVITLVTKLLTRGGTEK
jgi:hypothetical protein